MWQDPNAVPRPRAPFEQDPDQQHPDPQVPGNPGTGNPGNGHGAGALAPATPGPRAVIPQAAAPRAGDVIAGLRREQRKARLWMAASATTVVALAALAAYAIVTHHRSARLETSWPVFFLMSIFNTHRFARRLGRLRDVEASLREEAGGTVSPAAP